MLFALAGAEDARRLPVLWCSRVCGVCGELCAECEAACDVGMGALLMRCIACGEESAEEEEEDMEEGVGEEVERGSMLAWRAFARLAVLSPIPPPPPSISSSWWCVRGDSSEGEEGELDPVVM
jgi:hypothetical protein